jgi:hypothetical protein
MLRKLAYLYTLPKTIHYWPIFSCPYQRSENGQVQDESFLKMNSGECSSNSAAGTATHTTTTTISCASAEDSLLLNCFECFTLGQLA